MIIIAGLHVQQLHPIFAAQATIIVVTRAVAPASSTL